MFIEGLTPFWWGVYRWAVILAVPGSVFAAIGIKTMLREIKATNEAEQNRRVARAATRIAKYHADGYRGHYE